MFIYLDIDDAGIDEIKGDICLKSRLDDLISSHRKKQNIVFGRNKIFDFIGEDQAFSDWNRNIALGIKRERYDYQTMMQQLDFLVLVKNQPSFEVVEENNVYKWIIPLASISNFDFMPAVLLTEGHNDFELYKMYADLYLYHNRLSRKFVVNLEKDSGGGSGVARSLREYQNSKAKFCLCIVDSGKKHPTDSNDSTFNAVTRVYQRDSMSFLKIIPVHELENTIPPEFFKLINNHPFINEVDDYCKICSEIDLSKYVDLKKGLSLSGIFDLNDPARQYWLNLFNGLSPKYKNRFQRCLDFDSCNSAECSCTLISENFVTSARLEELLVELERQTPQKILELVTGSSEVWLDIGHICFNFGISPKHVSSVS